jgi:type II secretory pathway pseudopilin PulG
MIPTERQGGFTYLLLLLVLTTFSLTMLKSADLEKMRWQEQLEDELLFRGEQYRAAIEAYHTAGSGCFPVNVEQLQVDKRGAVPRYHLRQVWGDPLTGQKAWGMIYDPQGRWTGVHSLGTGTPRRKTGFAKDGDKFAQAKSYADWAFKVKSNPQAPLPSACGK